MVDEPPRLLLEQAAVGMNVHRLLVLHRLIASFTEPRRVVEVSRCYGLKHTGAEVLSSQGPDASVFGSVWVH